MLVHGGWGVLVGLRVVVVYVGEVEGGVDAGEALVADCFACVGRRGLVPN